MIDTIEDVLGAPCSNLCRPLNSYINRVYEAQLEDETWVVAKFYRPGRWSREALQDELDFVADLQVAEVPVVAPIPDATGKLLHKRSGMHFAIYPRRGGRICDELNSDQWGELGRLLGRVHLVGAEADPQDRIHLAPHASAIGHLEYILNSDQLTPDHRREYEQLTCETLDEIQPLFEEVDLLRIHGDLHLQNLIHRPDEGFVLIDFDDMALGPAVQDLWMLLPGRLGDCRAEVDRFLAGYEMFMAFDMSELCLIEPLRLMRFLHFTAWCARQVADGGPRTNTGRLLANFGSSAYWGQEIQAMRRQQVEIRDALEAR